MRAQHGAADKEKTKATDEAALHNTPNPPEDRGFGAFGAILISFFVALLGTAAMAVLFDVSWGWWLILFIGFGVTTMAALIGFVFWKEK